MKKGLTLALAIAAISLLPTILLWLPYFFRLSTFWTIPLPKNGLETIVANYDGPLYMVVAKSLYNKEIIESSFQFPLPTEYYAAHFPLFPLLIRAVGLVTNYPYAMLIATLLTSVLAIYFFHKLISLYVNNNEALFITMVFAIFPARWLIVRSVGSADPLFVGSIIASLYYFKKGGTSSKNYWLSGIWGLIAQLTKSPGIILFISYIVYFLLPTLNLKSSGVKFTAIIKKAYPLLLIPLAALGVFSYYYFTQGNFWAYFDSGDNIHLFFPPFQIFNYAAPWVGTFWLEEVIFIYLFATLGVYKLLEKKEYEIGVFSAIFLVLSLFISHRDLLRYVLPLVPFLFVAFAEHFNQKGFKLAFAVIVIPVYLYSLAFISQNVMPVANWSPFL
jgi:hypothetical protein